MKDLGCLITIILFGSFFLFVGLLAANQEYTFFKNATEKVEGTVIDVETVKNKKGYTSYKPVFSYTTKSGKNYVCSSTISTKPALYDKGETVMLYYDPAHPEVATPDSFVAIWLTPIFFCLVGIAIISFGIWFTKWTSKQ
jgi:Protein of unknown function (DUF3592)